MSCTRHLKSLHREQICTAGVQLARLQAISHGETTLTTQRWQKMRKLEHARAERTRASKS